MKIDIPTDRRLALLKAQLEQTRERTETIRQQIEALEAGSAAMLRAHPEVAIHPKYLELQKVIATNRKELLRIVATDAEIRALVLKIEGAS